MATVSLFRLIFFLRPSIPTFCLAEIVAPASVVAGVNSLSRSLSTSEPVEKTVSGPEDMVARWSERKGRKRGDREREEGSIRRGGKMTALRPLFFPFLGKLQSSKQKHCDALSLLLFSSSPSVSTRPRRAGQTPRGPWGRRSRAPSRPRAPSRLFFRVPTSPRRQSPRACPTLRP